MPHAVATRYPPLPAAPFAALRVTKRTKVPAWRVLCAADDQEEVKDLGVNVALSMLKFYKREISPLLPSSCRYVPTCSEYSMQAYKRYGVVKGTILTAWRLCRCNPLGGYGYDPPRWFGSGHCHKLGTTVVVSRESFPVDYTVSEHDWISEISMLKIVNINGVYEPLCWSISPVEGSYSGIAKSSFVAVTVYGLEQKYKYAQQW